MMKNIHLFHSEDKIKANEMGKKTFENENYDKMCLIFP